MLHSPLFFVWIGWVLVIGVIAVVRSSYVRHENAERERKRAERASRQIGCTAHPIRPPQRQALPPGYRQHLIDAGIIKPAGDPT
jgi:hypothetical protein